MSHSVTILYVDDYLIVCDKPEAVLSVPGRGIDKQDCVLSRLQQVYPEARIVHRLDMVTSGVMVFARGGFAERMLHKQFRERTVGKRYYALVQGSPTEARGCIRLPLASDWQHRPKQKVCHQQGKPSVSHWRVLAKKSIYGVLTSLLSIQPLTGRSHQIRVHLAESGMPIIGDRLYNIEDCFQPTRTMLHATMLSFSHPVTGCKMLLRSKLPHSIVSWWHQSDRPPSPCP